MRSGGGGLLAFAACLLVAITLLARVQDLAESLMRTYTGERMVLAIRSRLFHHVQRLSLSHADSKGTSDAVYRILYDAPAIQQIAIAAPSFASVVTVAMVYGCRIDCAGARRADRRRCSSR
jgi:ABC-type multidrug transport system fused ATPase/permease subunit